MINIYAIKIHKKIDQGTFDSLMSLVSIEKRDRIMRFKLFNDAHRCLLGDLLARYTICNKLNIKNDQLEFGCNKYGKPILLKPEGLHFNISHSGDWVVCAVDTQPIGIDIEVIKPIDFNIAERFFTENEYSDLMNQNENDRLKYFYRLWTLKESYIKAAGKGLSIPLNSFAFTIKHQDILLTTDNEFEASSFWQHSIDKEHIISVCYSNESIKHIEIISLSSLLLLLPLGLMPLP